MLLKIAVVFFLMHSVAYAWGPTGHRVVGQVATNHLSKTAKEKLNVILAGESLAEVSVWADEIKSEKKYNYMMPWHYTNSIKKGKYHKDPKSKVEDIITKLKFYEKQFKKGKFDPIDVKMYVHLVGDLHQPLHAGYASDKGGNLCHVKWFGKYINLHQLWDFQLIDSTKLSFTELTQFIDKPSGVSQVNTKVGVIDWAIESNKLVPSVYPEKRKDSTGRPLDYCQANIGQRVKGKNRPHLSFVYRYQHITALKRRLLEAGVRLAHRLNGFLK